MGAGALVREAEVAADGKNKEWLHHYVEWEADAMRLAYERWIGAGKPDEVRSPRGSSSDGSQRRRGRDGDIPWRRVEATPRPRRGHSVETSRGTASATM